MVARRDRGPGLRRAGAADDAPWRVPAAPGRMGHAARQRPAPACYWRNDPAPDDGAGGRTALFTAGRSHALGAGQLWRADAAYRRDGAHRRAGPPCPLEHTPDDPRWRSGTGHTALALLAPHGQQLHSLCPVSWAGAVQPSHARTCLGSGRFLARGWSLSHPPLDSQVGGEATGVRRSRV